MKKLRLGTFLKVLIAIASGLLVGMVLPDVAVRICKTFSALYSQLIKFIIPLLVLGLVTPAVADAGKNAGKMLLTVVVLAYCSTILAGLFAYGCCSGLFPHFLDEGSVVTSAAGNKTFASFVDLKIPPLCDMMTALVLAFMIGIGIIVTKSAALKKGFDEFGCIVRLTLEKVIIPTLPLYVFTLMCEMSASGSTSVFLGSGLKVIGTGAALTIIYLLVQYGVAGIVSKKNPLKCLRNMLPAYATGFATCSSSATIPVTQKCVMKNGVSEKMADFTVPLCATIHMCGGTIKLATVATAVAFMTGSQITFPVYLTFVLMQAVMAIAAPSVMGGVLMASLGLLDSVLGFTPDQVAMVMTIYLAFDCDSTACNVTGDGAIALIMDRICNKHISNDEKKV